MSLVLLVRHGQASFGAADYDVLSELGERQAALVGAALAQRGVEPAVVVRGTLRRHRQTTEAAMAAAGWTAEVVEDADWDEFDRHRVGHESAAPSGTVEEQVREFEASVSRWSSGEHDQDYRESMPAFRTRVDRALSTTLQRLGARETAVVFTSGGPVSAVTAALIGADTVSWQRFADVVVNTSVTKVLDSSRGVRLVSFNDHTHLEGPGHEGLVTYR